MKKIKEGDSLSYTIERGVRLNPRLGGFRESRPTLANYWGLCKENTTKGKTKQGNYPS